MNRRVNLKGLISLFAILAVTSASATPRFWTSDDDWPYWSNPDRWSPVGVPTAADDLQLGYQAADTNFALVYSNASAASVLTTGFGIVSENNMDIENLIYLENNSNLDLYFIADLNVGQFGNLPSINLTNSSYIALHSSEYPTYTADINAEGPIWVDATSEIRGSGHIYASQGINLNGTLTAVGNGLALHYTASTPNFDEIDLDGSNETGILDAGSTGAHLTVPGQFADPLSGSIIVGSKSTLQFTGPGTVIIDGQVNRSSDGVPGDTDNAATIQANHLVFAETSSGNLGWGNFNISAQSFVMKGVFQTPNTHFHVNTLEPWRLEGEIHNYLSTELFGSPMIIGSNDSGIATITSHEPVRFHVPVTLESTATINAFSVNEGSLCTYVFNDTTVLQSPTFNVEYAPWVYTDEQINIPADVYFRGNVIVESDTTVYATYASLGNPSNVIPNIINIENGQLFALDAKSLVAAAGTTININPGATLDTTIRDASAPYWVSEATLSFDNGTLNGADLCNRGNIVGIGTINANILASADASPCSGTVAPGFSPGTLTFSGKTSFRETTFEMEIGGSNQGKADLIYSTGPMQIRNGILKLHFINGFTPQSGDTFRLFDSSLRPMKLNFSQVLVNGFDVTDHVNLRQLGRNGTFVMPKEAIHCLNLKPGKKTKRSAYCKASTDLFKIR